MSTEPRAIAGKEPPRNLQAQRAVLSACLLSPDVIDTVASILQPRDMVGSDGDVLAVIFDLQAGGAAVDIVSVAEELRRREALQRCGGPGYLGSLCDESPSIPHVETHARIVRNCSRERAVIAECQRIAAEGYYDHGPTQAWLDGAAMALDDLARPEATDRGGPVREAMVAAFKQLTAAAERRGVPGWPTGLRDLDRRLGGLEPGCVTVIGARPGMGKTALAMGMAQATAGASQGGERLAACVFSLEMPRDQLARRLAFTRARVNPNPLKAGRDIGPAGWEALTVAATEISALPLWIDDTEALSPMALRARARQVRADYQRKGMRLAVVVVDYLQLMTATGMPRGASREQEVAACSKALKSLAKELGVHVVALSQLNRGVEARGVKDRRPRMSDLRESGSVEQDADNIVLVYREDYYNPKAENAGETELLIEKQRSGERGVVKVRFTDYCTRFDDLAEERWGAWQGGDEG